MLTIALDAVQFAAAAEHRFLATSPLLVACLTADGVLRLASPCWSSALGIPMHSVSGKYLVDFIAPEDGHAAVALIERADTRPYRQPVRFALMHRDGTRRTFGWHFRIDRDGMRFIIGVKADGPAVYGIPR
jgi:hypothetical protein